MGPTASKADEIYMKAADIAKQIEKYAQRVDDESRFPEESLRLLRENGLMGVTVSKQFGGEGISLNQTLAFCRLFGGSCLATGMIWSMHIQQVEIISRFAKESLKRRLLAQIIEKQAYVVSVTSVRSGNKGPFATEHAIEPQGNHYLIERFAPTVTGGAHGDIFLTIVRADATTEKLTFAVAERSQVSLEIHDSWDVMGMRGTESCELHMKGEIPNDQVFDPELFDNCCLTVMNPWGHLVWASTWFGAVKKMYSKFIKLIRHPNNRQRYNLDSELLLHEVGVIRSKLDLVETYIDHFSRYYEQAVTGKELMPDVKPLTYKVKVNDLKIISSELLTEATDRLMQLGGLVYGYSKQEDFPLERLYRDIRSSKLMLNNSGLLVANGRFSLFEGY
ncbi:acyl-CoA dehydrogenase family protein [Cohnella soli]|uniref:Acyl-CoA dehydrogenase family protein n=1 Tax=Cohnella soli TaxID=425005 RepID=A0ABW0HSY9_9BACL